MNRYIALIRVQQYYKNLIIFIALILSNNLFNLNLFLLTLIGFVILCLSSSFMYIINDIHDIEKDKQHPNKKNRPLPSGLISKNTAIFVAMIFLMVSLWLSFLINAAFLLIVVIFIALGLAYTFLLKNIFIVDAIIIGINFILRAVAGATAISVVITSWLIICTFLLALVLVFSKRSSEIKNLAGNDASKHRKVLRFYNKEITDKMLSFSLTSLFVSYVIYTVTQTHALTVYTIPIIAFIFLRFIYIQNTNDVEKAESILKDKYVLLGIFLWSLSLLVIYYAL